MSTQAIQGKGGAPGFATALEAHVPPYSDVGLIAKDWRFVPLHRISDFITKGSTPTTYGFKWEHFGILFLRSECVSLHGLDLGQSMFISPAAHAMLRRSEVRDGDLLITITGNVGRVVLLRDVGVANINQHIARIRVSAPDAEASYVYHFLSQAAVRKRFESITTGQAYPQISLRQVREAEVPLPPLPEQRTIAEALSDVDGLLAALETLIAKKRAIKQAAMQQLLTGRTRLPGFSADWETRKIRDIATLSGDRNSLSHNLPVLACSKHLGFVDSLGYFKNQVFSKDLSSYKLIRRGEIGYPANHVEEGSIGLQDLYDVALVSPIYVVFTSVEGVNGYFLHRLLKLESYREAFATATNSSVDRRGSLRWPQFSEISVTMPPSDEQAAIAAVLADMESEIASLEARRDKTRAIEKGMMQQLLTGRIRLVKPSPAEAGS